MNQLRYIVRASEKFKPGQDGSLPFVEKPLPDGHGIRLDQDVTGGLMNGLLEFVFEGVPISMIGQCVLKLIRHSGNVTSMVCDGDDSLPISFAFDAKFWSEFVARDVDASSIFLNLVNLEVGERLVDGATLQVVQYSSKIDLVILVSSEDCKRAELIGSADMHDWAEGFAKFFKLGTFFGGLEPAHDKQTQLFSMDGVGPVLML